jgi:hypothetical protein
MTQHAVAKMIATTPISLKYPADTGKNNSLLFGMSNTDTRLHCHISSGYAESAYCCRKCQHLFYWLFAWLLCCITPTAAAAAVAGPVSATAVPTKVEGLPLLNDREQRTTMLLVLPP